METNSMDLKSHAYLVLEQEACWLWKVAPDARGIGNSGIKLRARFPTFDILKILKEKSCAEFLNSRRRHGMPCWLQEGRRARDTVKSKR